MYNVAYIINSQQMLTTNMFILNCIHSRTSLVAQMVKSLPSMWETQVRSLSWEDPLEKEMAIHSSIAWKISQLEKPGGLQSMGLQRVGQSMGLLVGLND